MRSKKPIKLRRASDSSRWIVPVLCMALTLSTSLVIAVAWQNMTTDDTIVASRNYEDPLAILLDDKENDADIAPVIKGEADEQPNVLSEHMTEPAPPDISDYYGMIFPKSDRVTSDYFSDAVFIGDSLTTGFMLYKTMDTSTVLAATGINLSSVMTAEVITTPEGGKITVLDALAQNSYKKIYIMMGANGIGYLSNEKTLELYGAFIDEVRAICPDSIIYIQSILPINEPKYRVKYNGSMTNADIDAINGGLLALAGEKKCLYLDVASVFKDESGHMPDASTPDGIHLNPAGYTTWFDYLKAHAFEQKEV